MFEKKCEKGLDKGGKWLSDLLYTLRTGCGEDTSVDLSAEQLAQVKDCFGLVSKHIADDGVITKEELVKVGDRLLWQHGTPSPPRPSVE